MPRFEGACFQLEYPAHWEVEIIEDIPAFYDSEGAGALQVAAVRPAEGRPLDLAAEMTLYLARHGIAFQPDSVTVYESRYGHAAMACEFMSQDRFWLTTLMADGQRLLIVTYNADELPEEAEAYTISGIINSIEFSPEDASDFA